MDESELTRRLEALERRVLWSDILKVFIFIGFLYTVNLFSNTLHKRIDFQMQSCLVTRRPMTRFHQPTARHVNQTTRPGWQPMKLTNNVLHRIIRSEGRMGNADTTPAQQYCRGSSQSESKVPIRFSLLPPSYINSSNSLKSKMRRGVSSAICSR